MLTKRKQIRNHGRLVQCHDPHPVLYMNAVRQAWKSAGPSSSTSVVMCSVLHYILGCVGTLIVPRGPNPSGYNVPRVSEECDRS